MIVSEPKAQPSHNQHALLMRGGTRLSRLPGHGGQTSRVRAGLYLPFDHLLSRCATLNITQRPANLVAIV